MKTQCLKILLIVVVCISLGCQNKTEHKQPAVDLSGTWRLNSEETIAPNSHEVFQGDSRTADVLSFFPDGSYTRLTDSGKLHAGKWELSKDQSFITFIDSGELSTPYELSVNEYGRKTFSFENPSRNKRYQFIKEFDTLFNYKTDPLYYDNNKWREKPVSELTDYEIRAKVANYVWHLALLLDAARDRKQDVISFEFSRGPIKIYSGGIGVHPFNNVPSYWKNCFYNETEALKAYNIYASAVANTDYRLAGSGNWLKDDYRILNAIYNFLSKP